MGHRQKFYITTIAVFMTLLQASFGAAWAAGAGGGTRERLPTVDERLDASFNLIFSDPKAASVELRALARLLPELNKDQKAKFHNVHAVYQAVTGREDLAEKSFLKSLEFTDADDPARANTLNNLAIINKNRGDYAAAFQLLEQSMALYEKEGDQEGMAKALSERASVYKLMGLHELAVDHLIRAVDILESHKDADPRIVVSTKQRLANLYLTSRDYEFAFKLYDEVLPQFQSLGNRLDYAATLLNKAEASYQLNRYEESLEWVAQALPILKGFQNYDLMSLAYLNRGKALVELKRKGADESFSLGIAEAIRGEGVYRFALTLEYGRLLLDQGKSKQALQLLSQVVKDRNLESEDLATRSRYYALRADLYSALGRSSLAQDDYNQAIALRDSLYDQDLVQRARALQTQYKTELLEEENEQMALDLRWNRIVAVLTSVLALALAGVAGYAYYVHQLKVRLKQNELVKMEQEAKMLSENVELKEEIIAQQKAQLISSALETSQWMEKFQSLASKAESMGIQSLRDEIDNATAQDRHWSMFIERFRQLNPNFMGNLSSRYPDLTKGELEFCSMARMNLSFKEIANLLNISHQSVHMKKYRITKKMNLEGDDDFYSLLRSF